MIFQHCVRQCFKRFKALMIIDAHHLISLFLPLLEDLSGCTLAFLWQVVTFAKNVLYIHRGMCEEPSSKPFLGSNWLKASLLCCEELLLPLISGQIEKKSSRAGNPIMKLGLLLQPRGKVRSKAEILKTASQRDRVSPTQNPSLLRQYFVHQ